MSSQSRDGIVAVSASFIALCTGAVGLRFYARRQKTQPVLADDWTALLALVSFIGSATCIFISARNKYLGYSSNISASPEDAAKFQSPNSYQLQIAQVILCTSTVAFIKLSAVFFYRRIFCVHGPLEWFDLVTRATIVLIILWLFVFDFMTGFQCGTHFSALWDGSYLEYCTLSFPVLYGAVISDFLLDVWILVLPIPRVLKLHTSSAKKLSIIGVFLLAFIGLGAAIARMVQYIKIEEGGPLYFLYNDEEQSVTKAIYFSMLEAGMSLLAVNLPSLWVLLISIEPKKMMKSALSLTSLLRKGGSGEQFSDRSGPSSSKEEPPVYRGDVKENVFEARAVYDLEDARRQRQDSARSIQVDRSWELKQYDPER